MAHSKLPVRCMAVCTILLGLLLIPLVSADNTYVQWQDELGESIWLRDDRKPALYTDNFGSCLENGLIDVTRFDAALYHDNMTLKFDIQGTTNISRDSVMSMFAFLYDFIMNLADLVYSLHRRLRLWRVPLRATVQPMRHQHGQRMPHAK
jgi:hypothetical protein